jgi:hypothetical protein
VAGSGIRFVDAGAAEDLKLLAVDRGLDTLRLQ